MFEAITPFARVDFRNDHRVFGIRDDDRRFHCLTIGRTGTGKSTLMSHLIRGDIEFGKGVGVIDPHGDLAVTAKRACASGRCWTRSR
jgi:type IV secretory pathway VirB4 component